MTIEDSKILNQYKRLVPFLGELLGTGCEILLHDVSDPYHSTIAIANGFHSGRKIGSPLTDFGLNVLHQGTYENCDYISNYSGSGKGKHFVSSTFFIKNENKLIGMLCINRDISTVLELENIFASLKSKFNLENTSAEINESLDSPVPEMIRDVISKAIRDMGVLPDHMQINERIALIQSLKKQQILGIKGAVAETARQLGISVPTVYRYMKKGT